MMSPHQGARPAERWGGFFYLPKICSNSDLLGSSGRWGFGAAFFASLPPTCLRCSGGQSFKHVANHCIDLIGGEKVGASGHRKRLALIRASFEADTIIGVEILWKAPCKEAVHEMLDLIFGHGALSSGSGGLRLSI